MVYDFFKINWTIRLTQTAALEKKRGVGFGWTQNWARKSAGSDWVKGFTCTCDLFDSNNWVFEERLKPKSHLNVFDTFWLEFRKAWCFEVGLGSARAWSVWSSFRAWVCMKFFKKFLKTWENNFCSFIPFTT